LDPAAKKFLLLGKKGGSVVKLRAASQHHVRNIAKPNKAQSQPFVYTPEQRLGIPVTFDER
jgi:hypothetical protein